MNPTTLSYQPQQSLYAIWVFRTILLDNLTTVSVEACTLALAYLIFNLHLLYHISVDGHRRAWLHLNI